MGFTFLNSMGFAKSSFKFCIHTKNHETFSRFYFFTLFKRLCVMAPMSRLISGHASTTRCEISFSCFIIRSSRKSYGNISVHSLEHNLRHVMMKPAFLLFACAKAKAQISCTVTKQLSCVFVLANLYKVRTVPCLQIKHMYM